MTGMDSMSFEKKKEDEEDTNEPPCQKSTQNDH